MPRSLVIFAFLGLCFSCGCGRVNPVAVERPAPEPASSELSTFLVDFNFDPGLPAPGQEDVWGSAATLPETQPVPDRATSSVGPAVFWARTTTDLGLEAKLLPPLFARGFALVEIGIYDAPVIADHPVRPSLDQRAVAAGVADEVLGYLFPARAQLVHDLALAQARQGGRHLRGSWFLGHAIGCLFVRYGKADGSDQPFTGTMPSGPGIWTGVNPVLTMCGTWKSWLLTGGDQFQPRDPYAYGSPADLADVAEVLEVSLHLTPEQLETPLETVHAAARAAHAAGAKFILDPAPARALPDDFLRLVDVIRPNSGEVHELTGIRVTDRASAGAAARMLIGRGVGAACVQAGDLGDLLVTRNEEVWLPRLPVDSVDATGAGTRSRPPSRSQSAKAGRGRRPGASRAPPRRWQRPGSGLRQGFPAATR